MSPRTSSTSNPKAKGAPRQHYHDFNMRERDDEGFNGGKSTGESSLTLKTNKWEAGLEHAAIGCIEGETRAASTGPSLPV